MGVSLPLTRSFKSSQWSEAIRPLGLPSPLGICVYQLPKNLGTCLLLRDLWISADLNVSLQRQVVIYL